MIIELKIPSPGESITEVELASWFVENGSFVTKDQEIGEVESEKATLPLIAEKAGKVELLAEVGDTLNVGAVVCKIDTSVQPEEKEGEKAKGEEDGKLKEEAVEEKKEEDKEVGDSEKEGQEVAEDDVEVKGEQKEKEGDKDGKEGKDEEKKEAKEEDGKGKEKQENGTDSSEARTKEPSGDLENVKSTPVARKMMLEEGFSVEDIISGLRKITSSDVQAVKKAGTVAPEEDASDQTPAAATAGAGVNFNKPEASRELQRNKMSQLRKKISERLVAVRNETAMLTTFNEADMSAVIAIRKKHQDQFIKKHDVKLGFMSFFTKAVTMALQQFPEVNSYMDGEEIVTPGYCD
ncbi:MAG: 2-oxo acid dehydrogenase subunit E2, partial [Bacteroidales bacterium]|nr:2-oxo acid dehydrogenase subunit E2 [Bacteroidales bacterium]